ncbi:hypothetical protein AVEN_15360-1 [Araneus ventricosus]|uniref:Uncharacterized protein n=1 Tax=Araneus ventricosus TaxID=182803 RepID=A0A4Y2QTI7_ARAVE|nr:hypothetical protein AVEN_15360-1 [Araneus ventricosus]
MGCMRRSTKDFPPELLQHFFNFASSEGIAMQEDDTIIQHGRMFGSDGFTMAQRLFPKLKEQLSGTRFFSNSDVKTAAENWLNGKLRDFNQAWFKKLVLRTDECLNSFDDYVEN